MMADDKVDDSAEFTTYNGIITLNNIPNFTQFSFFNDISELVSSEVLLLGCGAH